MVEALEQRLVLSGGAPLEAPLFTQEGSDAPVYFQPLAGQDVFGSSQSGVDWFGYGPSSVGTSSTQWGELQGSDTLRDDPRFSFADGSGYASVILDTGIDVDHPFFGTDADSDGVSDRIVYQYDFANGDDDATDYNGHGSNVSSIIGSSDSSTPGVAPGVDIIHLKVFTDSGGGTFGYIENALQWVIANADTYNIASVNMSLSDSLNHSTAKQRYGIDDEIQTLAGMGVTVVSAAGNRFYDFASAQGVAYPAADPYSLAVGATYSHNAGGPWTYSSGAKANTTDADRLAPFSQRSGTLTDIFAPGAPIRGAGSAGNQVTMHGTSQASPQVAGAIVLAQQIADYYLERWLDLTEIRSLLASSGETINDGDDEDDNVTNTNLDFARLDIQALAEAIWAMAPSNQAPVIDASGSLNGAVAGQSFTISFADLVSATNASDPDNDAITLRIASVSEGATLTLNNVTVTPGSTTLSSGDELVWTPGVSAYGSTAAFTVDVFDGAEYSTGAASVEIDVNGIPIFDAVASFDGADAGQPFEITYDQLLAASDATDPDGDEITFEVVIAGSGTFFIDGVIVTNEATFSSGQTLRWTPPESADGLTTALLLRATDGVTFADGSVILSVDVTAAPDPFAAAPDAGVVGAAGDGSSWVATRSQTGSLALFRQTDHGDWETIDLGVELGLGEITSDIVTWIDPATGATSFAFATNEGLLVVADQGVAGFTVESLSNELNSTEIPVDGLTSFRTIDGRIGIAGVTSAGDLVLFLQQAGPGTLEWTFRNLTTQDLAANGQTTPDFQGSLVSYVTSWNGLHIAGLDSNGDIQAVWWAPGLDNWQTANLSSITGAPEMSGGLTAFITNWGAINLSGVAADGSLTVTWWMPSFGGEWRNDDLTASIDGPALQTGAASSFVTPWGGLNIVSLRDDGELVVYWWAPGLDAWRTSALSESIDGAQAPIGGVSGVSSSGGDVMLLGANADGDVLRFSWSPTSPWSFEVLTPAA